MNDNNQSDPFNPNLRRVGPADLPPMEHTTGRAARISKIPAGSSARSTESRNSTISPIASCEGCGGAGYYLLRVPYGHPQFGKLQPCDCASYQRQLAPRAARLGDELGSMADKTFDSFRVDRKIEPTTWQNAPMSVATQRGFLGVALTRCQDWADDPRGWLYLHGAFGAGKSHLAAAIANERQSAGAIVRFVTVGRLLDMLTAAIRDGSTDSLMADLIACDMLILDELAAAHLAECASDWRFGRIERLINERLSKPMVITSNLAIDDLALPGDVRAERVADRIAEVSQIVWMPIASYRRIAQEVAS